MRDSDLGGFQQVITHDADLDIVISDDRKRVTIHVVTTTVPEGIDATPLYRRETAIWTLEARKFGPQARFILSSIQKTPRWKRFAQAPEATDRLQSQWQFSKRDGGDPAGDYYRLKIEKIRFGRNADRSLTYVFGLRQEVPGDGYFWTVRAETSFWGDELSFGADAKDARAVPLRDHAGGTPPLYAQLIRKKERLGDTLLLIFNGLLAQRGYQIDKKKIREVASARIALSQDIVWTVEPLHGGNVKPLLVGLHRNCLIRTLQFTWCVRAGDGIGSSGDLMATELGFCAAFPGTAPTAVIGAAVVEPPNEPLVFQDGTSGHGVRLTPIVAEFKSAEEGQSQNTSKDLVLRLRIEDAVAPDQQFINGKSVHDLLDGKIRAIGVLEANWELSILCEDETGPFLPLAGQLRAESCLAGSGFKFEVTFKGDFVDGESRVYIASPIGRALVSGVAPTINTKAEEDPFRQPAGTAVRVALVPVAPQKAGTKDLTPLFDYHTVSWAEVACLLREASIAPEGVCFSRLMFDRTAVTLLFAELQPPEVSAGSTIFLNPASRGRRFGILDLTGATLHVGRDADLVSLSFRFASLFLDVRSDAVEFVTNNPRCSHLVEPRTLRNLSGESMYTAEESSEALRRRSARGHDTRPTLVVEFPPQHVMEEAFFLPGPVPLPDNAGVGEGNKMPYVQRSKEADGSFKFEETLTCRGTASSFGKDADGSFIGTFTVTPTDADAILTALSILEAPSDRIEFREKLQNIKGNTEAGPGSHQDRFAAFAKKYKESTLHDERRSNDRVTPLEQRIYIGPYAMDPDAFAIARQEAEELWNQLLTDLLVELFEEVLQSRARLWNDSQNSGAPPTTFERQLLREAALESAVPSYQQFRSFHRDRKLAEAIENGNFEPGAETLEYRIPDTPLTREQLDDGIYLEYKTWLSAREDPTGLAEARLSRPSRLAFAVNCRELVALERPETVKDADIRDTASLTGQKMNFSFAALTNWGAMELRVVRRAERVFLPAPDGRLDANTDRRIVDVSPSAMLDHLGFTDGPLTTANVRLAEVHGALSARPTTYESEIVVPARLSLSTHSDAVFLTPQAVPGEIFNDGGDDIRSTCTDVEQTRPLWTARLFCDGLDPGLRAVYSPDLRADFVFTGVQKRDGSNLKLDKNGKSVRLGRLPGGSMPPGGALAPWFIGPGESIADHPTIIDLRDALAERLDKDRIGKEFFEDDDEREFCELLLKDEHEEQRKLFPQLFLDLCRHVLNRPSHDAQEGFTLQDYNRLREFRTSLSARDRAELVILGSAWGLPVVGRRSLSGGLTADSSQAEPEERHRLADVMPGSALYVPRPLKVDELTLSALGASLRHNTPFQPPASARHIADRELFDALSIEQWQHWTVLGRDVFTEVVYKGFLIPTSHRAAMVKVTERTFIRDSQTKLIRAYLRQRIFIRCAKPKKRFPGIGQSNGGRRFPCAEIEILTTRTPDIVDPYDGAAAEDSAGPSGRIGLKDGTGLVFWPRTAKIDGAEVRFEMTVDGVKSNLPLIFVDNTAANDPGTMAALRDYYNGLESPDESTVPSKMTPGNPRKESAQVVTKKHKRTLALNGEKLRYAPEIRSGSASIETDYWTLAIEGGETRPPTRAASTNEGVAIFDLDNSDFVFGPVLQGADQPPVYPFVESCRVRLRQNERLSGNVGRAARAKMNGDFVVNGMPPREGVKPAGGDVGRWKDNPQEIFLDLVYPDQPELNMGSRGDQSGGIYQPSGNYVSISRKKGLLTFRGQIQSEILDVTSHGTLFTNIVLPDEKTTAHELAVGIAPKSDTDEIKRIYKRFFSQDAKLFGLVKITDIIAAIGSEFEDPQTGAPELIEQVRYGAQQAEGAAEESLEAVRETVVKPLSSAIKGVRRQWDAFDAELERRQSIVKQTGVILKAITLAEVFPELDNGLRELDAAIELALAETDPILHGLALSEVYEAGRRFLDAVVATSANPVERIAEAVEQRFIGLQDIVAHFVGDIVALAGNIYDAIRNELTKSGGDIIKFLINTIGAIAFPGRDADPWPYLPLPYPHFATLNGDRENVRLLLAPQAGDMKRLTVSILNAVAAGTKVDKIFEPGTKIDHEDSKIVVFDFLKAIALNRVPTARDRINELSVTQEEKDAALLELMAYDALLRGQTEFVDQFLRDALKNELVIAERMWTGANEVFHKLEDSNFADAGDAAVRFIEIFVGDINLDVKALCDDFSLSTILKKAGKAINLDRLALCPHVLTKDRGALRRCPENTFPLDQDFKPKPPNDDSICGRLYETQAKIDALLRTVTEAEVEKITRALKQDEAKKIIMELKEGLTSTRMALKAVGQASAATFCDLYNDTIDVGSLQTALKAAIGKLPGDHCSPANFEGDIRKLAELPKLLEPFARGRVAMLEHQTVRLDGLVETFIKLFKDKAFQQFIAAAGLGGALAQLWKDGASDADLVKKGKEVVENIKLATTTYVQELARMLASAAKTLRDLARELRTQIRALLADISSFNEKNGLITVKIEGLEKNLESIDDGVLSAIQPLVEALEKAAGEKNLTPEQLKNLKVSFDNSSFGALEFFDVQARIDFRTDILQRSEAAVSEFIATLGELGRKYVRNMQSAVLDELDSVASKALGLGTASIGQIYENLLEEREKLTKQIPDDLSKTPLGQLLLKNLYVVRRAKNFGHPVGNQDPLNPDRLMRDHQFLNSNGGWLLDKPVGNRGHRRYLRTFIDEWSLKGSDLPTPFRMGQQIAEFGIEIVRGRLLQLIPLEEIRDAIEEELLSLVPIKTDLSYGFGLKLGPEVGKATAGIFVPATNCPLRVDFKAELDMGAGNPQLELLSTGSLGAFDIVLVGEAFKAVTLHFSGASFVSRNGQKPKCDLVYSDFEIGPLLDFLQQLQSFLSPKDGSGFYLTFTRGFPGIEAGYSLSIGTIMMGNISIFNVSLNAAAIIPFDGQPTHFKCSLSRRDRPFTISYMPYGGSGFFSLLADCKGIIGFEASFEFGGAGAFGFGPLTGQGRIMSGIYIRQLSLPSGKIAEILGTFYAGGSAGIWIFSLSASLSVRMGQVNGNMVGDATFTFSFSLALKDFDYSIGVQKEEQQGFGGDSSASLAGVRDVVQIDIVTTETSGGCRFPTGRATITADVASPHREWDKYQTYFDRNIDLEEFF